MHFQVHIHIQCLNHSFASIPRRFIYVRYNIQSILLYNELLLPNFVPHYRLGNSLSLAFILIKDVYSEGILSSLHKKGYSKNSTFLTYDITIFLRFTLRKSLLSMNRVIDSFTHWTLRLDLLNISAAFA